MSDFNLRGCFLILCPKPSRCKGVNRHGSLSSAFWRAAAGFNLGSAVCKRVGWLHLGQALARRRFGVRLSAFDLWACGPTSGLIGRLSLRLTKNAAAETSLIFGSAYWIEWLSVTLLLVYVNLLGVLARRAPAATVAAGIGPAE
jgi:hypothetical protein